MSRANDVELIRTSGATSAERRALERDVRRGRFERLRPGVLVHPGAVDAVLSRRLSDRATLEAEFAALTAARSKAGIAIAMGSALSGSPAESVCRVRFRELGVPEPVQQHVFARAGSETAVVDFWFPDQGVVVEVDGRAKYEDPVMLDGRSTADVHWREKRREDFIRSCPGVRAVIRLSWSDLMQPDRVRAALRRAGVPCG